MENSFYIFTRSSALRAVFSDLSGEKWPAISLTEIQVGKAMPFSIFFLA